MARLDGALNLSKDGTIIYFGGLLDGSPLTNEDRSRCARFNSALRFSEANGHTFVLIASADGPITDFEGGHFIYSNPFSTVDSYNVSGLGIDAQSADKWLSSVESLWLLQPIYQHKTRPPNRCKKKLRKVFKCAGIPTSSGISLEDMFRSWSRWACISDLMGNN